VAERQYYARSLSVFRVEDKTDRLDERRPHKRHRLLNGGDGNLACGVLKVTVHGGHRVLLMLAVRW
jgi:hypothetical protein